ncbi:MAG: ORF6N domain-containing protein [Paludibacteraceae bacterium]|nr:ORF6N domain-containing protein [Paludibacteraceae bacterium]
MPKKNDIVTLAPQGWLLGDIRSRIFVIRGEQVMLDRDLAVLYGVEVRTLNQAVKRNIARFPKEFMYQLTNQELAEYKSQFVTYPKEILSYRRAPYAFTEQGVAMLSAVLKSPTAIQVSIGIMKAFVQARQILSLGQLQGAEIGELRARIEKLEKLMEVNQDSTKAIGEEVSHIYQAINALSAANQEPLPEIGFEAKRYKEQITRKNKY